MKNKKSDMTDDTVAGWLLRQLAIIGIITAVLSTVLALSTPWNPWIAVGYTLSITICCSITVQLTRRAVFALAERLGASDKLLSLEGFGGWALMLGSLALGTAIGYSAGVEIGNALTGIRASTPFNSSARRTLSIMMVALLPGLAVTFYFVGRHRVGAAKAQAAEAQLRLLQSQLEPHMLFNTLANLRVLIALDPVRAQAMLDQLIAFLRATLAASRQDSHPLRDEFARLKDYLALMQIRMGARLRPVFELPAELAELAVPPLLLQPLVENAIKHGLEPSVDGGELRISARRDGGQVVLEVRDDGVGLSSQPAGGGSNFGLHQVRERLVTRYGSAAAFTISPAPESGTVATIRLPTT